MAPKLGAGGDILAIALRPDLSLQPRGFVAAARNAGIRDASLDLTLVHSTTPAAAAAMFTRNHFCGHPVTVGREHIGGGQIRAVIVNSKNANVATGPDGLADCREICRLAGAEVGCAAEEVMPFSTGVIGRRLPMDRIRAGIAGIGANLKPGRLDAFAQAILTTDTHPKWRSVTIDGVTLAGCCKGAGMIEPNMATMLAFFFTDAAIPAPELDRCLRAAVHVSFNMLSIDSDTSTSDSVLILANGQAGPVDVTRFGEALTAMASELAQEVARDGEGATKLLEVQVRGAADEAAARRVAKSIVNSPLVKTAVWGGDPNWGRVAMAVGKCFDVPVLPERLRIAFGDLTVFAAGRPAPETLEALEAYLRGERVRITVDLGHGDVPATAWGCDLSPTYVHINGDYTT